MPIYEYRCQQCGGEFEYMQRMSEDPKTTCERCSGALERLISRTAFQLKGSGWYKDLYSSAKPAGGDAKAGGEAKSGEAKSGGEAKSSKSSPSTSGGD